ncbi:MULTISPECIES: preprotein translocase subunit YajC [unclassified Hahella]|uniref:preprotein translocase subunit YajC n=2 Tax=Hahella TaxID=158481 RepID=UPI000FDE06C3|nr:preprotein translocase subunit YajC [Hahella sp. CR1]AZZ93327.1 preprotein translocase subunit YajC [Hahella sp. KA22]MDG9671980.1 preprotein translocase subunit YajC [Hahella sp. CR1]QAY56701.1 preprotein translocase subunit YajC [Hahella sp. KA22]
MRKLHVLLGTLFALLMPAIAAAEPAPGPQGPSAVMQILFLGGFVLIFYFLVWRPQSKRAKEHRELLGGLNKNDEVLVNGGIAGKIVRVKDDFLVVEIADKVEIKVQKMAVTAALPKGTLKDI